MKRLFTITLALSLILFAAQALSAQDNSALYGEWKGGIGEEKFIFSTPDKWQYMTSSINGTYTLIGTNLTITTKEKTTGTARATINGNTLTIGQFSGNISKGFTDDWIGTYQRIGTAPEGSLRGEGWPPASTLSEYGLVRMSHPTEMTGIYWNIETDVRLVHIRFSGTAGTLTAVKNWFTSNGWTIQRDESSGRDTKIRYRKDRVNNEGDPNYFFETELHFDGRMGYIRAAIDW